MLNKQKYFNNKVLEIGQLSHTLRRVLSPYAYNPEKVVFIIQDTLPDGTHSSQFDKNYNDLEILCDISKQSIATSFKGKENSQIRFEIHGYGSYFSIEISCENPSLMNNLFDAIISELDIEERISPEEALNKSLNSLTSVTKDLGSELKSSSKTEDIEFDKVTIVWLIEHVPVRIWLYLISLLIGLAFGALYLGMKLGQLEIIREYFSK